MGVSRRLAKFSNIVNIGEAIARHITTYRAIVAIGFAIAAILALSIPAQMISASPWAYYYGVQNFAQGHLVIDDELHSLQVADAKDQGGRLMQYVEIDDNEWALEKAPGYVFYLVPFEWIGIPRWGNVFLALGMTIVTFVLLKRLRNERTACIGSLLMLFTPISLIMLNITYLDSFAALSFIVMGGGLYIYYHLERNKLRPMTGGTILFLAFLLASWSVVVRYTNFPIVAILVLHFVITRFIELRRGQRRKTYLEILPVVLGNGIPLAILLLYNHFIFGSPFDYGYNYSGFPVEFAFQYLGQVNDKGQSLPAQIILDNLANAPKALLFGFPLLLIGIPAFGVVLYRKLISSHKPGGLLGKWPSLHTELPWGILLILIGWFVSVFCLYLTYEFTAEYLGSHSSFIRFARFYLPGLFPVAIICALIMDRLPQKVYAAILGVLIIAGVIIYVAASV